MNERKYAMLERNLTSTARKVFGAVPVQAAWTSQAIYGELTRQGVRLDFAMVEGCLDSLKRDGLVKEVHRGEFQRVEVTRTPECCADDNPCGEPATTTRPETMPTPTPDLLTRMAALSTRLREVADEVDELALQAAAEIERAKAGSNRFDKLKELLKDVVG